MFRDLQCAGNKDVRVPYEDIIRKNEKFIEYYKVIEYVCNLGVALEVVFCHTICSNIEVNLKVTHNL